MKKGIAIGLVGVMMASLLTGCGSSSKYLVDANFSKYVDLCEYTGIEASKVTFDVTEDEIKSQIDNNLYMYITYEEITGRAAAANDTANIDYEVTIDGGKVDDYSGTGADIVIGAGYIFPEVDEALVGMKIGESKDVEVTFTADYVAEEDVGTKAKVKVTLNKLSKEVLPEYNEDFVKEYTEYTTMEEYEESVKQEIYASKEEQYEYYTVNEILTHIMEKSEYDGYPEALYEKCKKAYDDTSELYASTYGMEVEEYLETFGITDEVQKSEIEANVQYELTISAIAQKEKIDCTDEEVDEYVESICQMYGYDTAEDFYKDYPKEDMGYEVIHQKVCDFLIENAKITEITEEEYYESQMSGDEFTEDLDGEALDGSDSTVGGLDVLELDQLDDELLHTDESEDDLEADLEEKGTKNSKELEEFLEEQIENGQQ